MHMTVDKGVRASTSNAYLRRALKRSNLTLKKGIVARRFLLETQDSTGQSGLKAVSVEFEKSGNTQVAIQVAMANKEVISSAGSIGSVQLLQLSGIGPKAVKRRVLSLNTNSVVSVKTCKTT